MVTVSSGDRLLVAENCAMFELVKANGVDVSKSVARYWSIYVKHD
jgi:hypothetical protein